MQSDTEMHAPNNSPHHPLTRSLLVINSRNDVPIRTSGYYAGSLSSALMAGRFVSSHFWGRICDRHGCRFVLVVGLLSSAVLSLAFGFSTSFTWAVVCRCVFLFCCVFFLFCFVFFTLRRMGKNKTSAPTLPRVRYMSCID